MTKAQFLSTLDIAVTNTVNHTAPARCGPQKPGTHFDSVTAAKEWACDLGIYFGSSDTKSYRDDPVVAVILMFFKISVIFPLSLAHLAALEAAWEHYESHHKGS